MPPHQIPRVQSAAEKIADHMNAILGLFKPGAKITVVVRNTAVSDGSRDFIQTNDTIDNVIAALTVRKTAPTLTGDV